MGGTTEESLLVERVDGMQAERDSSGLKALGMTTWQEWGPRSAGRRGMTAS